MNFIEIEYDKEAQSKRIGSGWYYRGELLNLTKGLILQYDKNGDIIRVNQDESIELLNNRLKWVKYNKELKEGFYNIIKTVTIYKKNYSILQRIKWFFSILFYYNGSIENGSICWFSKKMYLIFMILLKKKVEMGW